MLENYNKKNPFKVPDSYFENLDREIMARLGTQEKKAASAKVVPLWRKIAPWASVAAVALVAFMVVEIDFAKFNSNTETDANYYSEQRANAIEDEYYSFVEEELSASTYEEFLLDEFGNEY